MNKILYLIVAGSIFLWSCGSSEENIPEYKQEDDITNEIKSILSTVNPGNMKKGKNQADEEVVKLNLALKKFEKKYRDKNKFFKVSGKLSKGSVSQKYFTMKVDMIPKIKTEYGKAEETTFFTNDLSFSIRDEFVDKQPAEITCVFRSFSDITDYYTSYLSASVFGENCKVKAL